MLYFVINIILIIAWIILEMSLIYVNVKQRKCIVHGRVETYKGIFLYADIDLRDKSFDLTLDPNASDYQEQLLCITALVAIAIFLLPPMVAILLIAFAVIKIKKAINRVIFEEIESDRKSVDLNKK
jgi:hypothetical protein